MELGVPADAILVEPKARNTGENIRFAQALLEERGVAVRTAVLVSKPYEERRAYATARKIWPKVHWLSASADVPFSLYVQRIGDARLVIDMMVGAQQRLLVYPRQGLVEPQHVPDDVAESYARLVSQGFTSRLIHR
jgi:hypothetical protein